LNLVTTLAEMKLTGNCLLGSRPVLHFDGNFEKKPHLKLIKEVLKQTFATPKGHPKSKPFSDHVFGFYILDDKIWFRNYQVNSFHFNHETDG
jgi:ribosome biogenesis protein BRX1